MNIDKALFVGSTTELIKALNDVEKNTIKDVTPENDK